MSRDSEVVDMIKMSQVWLRQPIKDCLTVLVTMKPTHGDWVEEGQVQVLTVLTAEKMI
jgi:hypothetical protein